MKLIQPAVLISPWMVSLYITLLALLILPDTVKKYQVNTHKKYDLNKNDLGTIYHDFDHDGLSEIIRFGYNIPDRTPFVIFRNNQNLLIRQWNLQGMFAGHPQFAFNDFNKNGVDELYTITYLNDSLRINAFEPLTANGFQMKDRCISPAKLKDGHVDWQVCTTRPADLNNDETPEVIFSIYAGYTLQPRAVFAWDVKNDSIWRSPVSGTSFIRQFKVSEHNEHVIITGQITSTNNYAKAINPDISCQDTCAWFFVLNENLEYIFPPKPFPGHPAGIKCVPFIEFGSIRFAVLFADSGAENHDDKLVIYDLKGNRIGELNLGKIIPDGKALYNQHDKAFLYLGHENSIYRLSDHPELSKYATLPENTGQFYEEIDIDGIGEEELLFKHQFDDELIITRSNGSHPVFLEVDDIILDNFTSFSTIRRGQKDPWFCISNSNAAMIVEYRKNPLYFLHFIQYPGIYITVLLFILLIQKLYFIRRHKQQELQHKIDRLQLESIKNRMDPHFIFNALNSISSLIIREEKHRAYRYITKFSKLIRENITSNSLSSRSIEEELEFVESYLELEQMRFITKFTYEIKIGTGVDLEFRIPRFIISTYVENAIKHGLFHKNTGGHLKIHILKTDGHYNMNIIDNGIGREAAGKLDQDYTGKGLEIMESFYAVYNQWNDEPVRQEIVDLFDDAGKPSGTHVRIRVPLNFKVSPETSG